jgi:hypothetical protein
MKSQAPLQFTFHVLIEDNQGMHVAYCLEMGLVATADTPDDLPSIMTKMIVRQVEFAIKNNNPQDIYHPAPPEVWEKFKSAAQQERVNELEQIERRIAPWLAVRLNSYVGATA